MPPFPEDMARTVGINGPMNQNKNLFLYPPQESGPNGLEVTLAPYFGRYQAPIVAGVAGYERRQQANYDQALQAQMLEQARMEEEKKLAAKGEQDAQAQKFELLKSLLANVPGAAAEIAGRYGGLGPETVDMILQDWTSKNLGTNVETINKAASAQTNGLQVDPQALINGTGLPIRQVTPTSTINAGISAAASGSSNPNKYDTITYWDDAGRQIRQQVPSGGQLPPPAGVAQGAASTDDQQFRARYQGQAYEAASGQYGPVGPPNTARVVTDGQGNRGFVFKDPQGNDLPPVYVREK